jgi:hypothetical protein
MFTCVISTQIISTRSVMSTCPSVNYTCMSVILKRTSVIMTRTSVTSTRRMQFRHTECELYTQSVISTHTSIVLTRMSVIMILTSVITTRKIFIFTCTSCIATRTVWFQRKISKKNPDWVLTSGYATDLKNHAFDSGTLRVIFTLLRVILTRYVFNYFTTI